MKFVKAPENGSGWFETADGTVLLVVLSVVLLVFAILALRFVQSKRWSGKAARYQTEVRNFAIAECRWQRGAQSEHSLELWICKKCGVDAFTSTGKPPRECKRQLKEALL